MKKIVALLAMPITYPHFTAIGEAIDRYARDTWPGRTVRMDEVHTVHGTFLEVSVDLPADGAEAIQIPAGSYRP